MSRQRLWATLALDLRFHLTRPMCWVLLTILALMAWGLSNGGLSISTGDSTIGGTEKAWITSEFAVSMMLPIVTFLLYSFFVAVAAGMLVPRDEELKVGPILHATRLTPVEYVWGKFAAALLFFMVILGAHLAFSIIFNQWVPNDRAELIRGPFELANYLRPALFLSFPFLIFLTGLSFAVGELTRRPILVFVTPVALFAVNIFFLWSWAPSWLDLRINRLLMWIEPTGYRWLNETWLKVDMGVQHYNHQPVGYDAPFLISRLVLIVVGLGAVFWAQRHLVEDLKGPDGNRAPGLFARIGQKLRRSKTTLANEHSAADFLDEKPVAAWQMKTRRPGFLSTAWTVARFEARNLRSQPGLYIFVPLILLQVFGTAFTRLGAFDTPLLLTPGVAAVTSMNTLSLLVCFLLLFYTVESVGREWHTGLSPMYYATPSGTAAVLTGKALANSLVGASILMAAYVAAAGVMLYQGKVAPSIGPFALIWGLLLVPTFMVWSTFVTFCWALTGNRYATYALGLGAMTYTGWKQLMGEMNWVGNWNLWSATTWTDFGGLSPHGYALFLNRAFWLSVAAFLVVLTVKLFPRREPDSGRLLDRARPANLWRPALRLLPMALPAIVIGIMLGVEVSNGFQGGAVERREEEYRARNLITWNDAEPPWITGVDVDLELDPENRSFQVKGTFDFENRGDEPMKWFPMSTGDHYDEVEWTLNGEAFEPEDQARLHVFKLQQPIEPGGGFRVGFAYGGEMPKGVSKNGGGGISEFILPEGVVLTAFSSSFLPLPVFEGGRGVDEDNQLAPKDFADGYWHGGPALGVGSRYPVATKITVPEGYRANGVGVLVSDTVVDGKHTFQWRSDYPVNFFNVVAGKWDVWEGEGVKIFYHPSHTYNLEEMGEALQGARRYFSEWFFEFPWQELKVSEFPGLAGYAQGFPTNITFSEQLGFLTRSSPQAQAAFMVTAHEAAHQWWGNILMPGNGPGGNILSEGMAHFSTALLFQQMKGERGRMEFLKQIEDRYGEARQVDAERPLVWTDGSRAGDGSVTYDKGGWVFWMLLEHMGRENGLAGYRDFIHRYSVTDDYPLLQDFLMVMREHAVDPEAFDDFTRQWFLEVVMPEYRVNSAETEQAATGWSTRVELENRGTGRMPVQVAAVKGERFAEDDDDSRSSEELWQTARETVWLDAGENREVVISSPFEPEKIVIDPDVKVLMLKREKAEGKVSKASS